MKIRTQINIAAAVSAITVVMVLAAAAFYFLQLSRVSAQTHMVADLNRNLSHLRFITVETIVYPSGRAIEQWRRKYESTGLMLNSAPLGDSAQTTFLNRIRTNYAVLDVQYRRLVENAQDDNVLPLEQSRTQERLGRAVTSLLAATQEMLDDVEELSRLNRSEAAAIQQVGEILALGIAAVLGVMIGWLTLLIRKRVLMPIAIVERGAGIVSSGELDHRLNLPAADEIGLLAAAFDAMTARLQASYERLKESEAFQRNVFEEAPDAIVLAAQSGRIVRVNFEAERMFGYPRARLIAMTVEGLMPTDLRLGHAALQESFFALPPQRAADSSRRLAGRRVDGTVFPVDVMLSPLRQSGGDLVIATIRDMTASQRSEEALRASEERFRGTLEHAPIGMALLSLEGHWIEVNRALCEIVGYDKAELQTRTSQQITHPSDLRADGACTERLLKGEMPSYQLEIRYIRKDGKSVPVMATRSLLHDGDGRPINIIAQIEDISARKEAEETIKAALREKETLLKELYHRVKNNLQVVGSLLNLQAGALPEGAARTALKEGADRVRAMAMVHEKLYQSGNLAYIELDEYVADLCKRLGHADAVDRRGVVLVTEVDPIGASLETAIPLGLLLNELISNCLRHAFPENRAGTITVCLKRMANGEVDLRVSDTGVGFPEGLNPKTSRTLGLKLVAALSAQLNGKLSFETRQGAHTHLVFRLTDRVEDHDTVGVESAI